MTKGFTKYTYDTCISLARDCKTRSEFKRKHPYAYVWARKNKWLDDYTWFENGKKKPKRYTLEHCRKVAMLCDTLKDFYTDHYPEWMASKRNGWLDGFDWLKRSRHIEWTFEECREVALRYSTKKEFREHASGAYCAARDKGWLDREFTWLVDETINLEYGRLYVVYCYEFFLYGDKYVYVGLSMRPDERDRRHRGGESSVRDFAISNHLVIPKMRILEDKLTQFEAREKEDVYRHKFIEEGCLLLNKGATGRNVGSVGGMNRKWTKRKCLEEARKYKTAQEFQSNNTGAYLAAIRHKWNKEITWFEDGHMLAAKERTKFNFERCRSLAKRFLSLKEFRTAQPGAYLVAKKSGWLEGYDWLFANEAKRKAESANSIAELYRHGLTIKKIAEMTSKSAGSIRKILLATIPSEFRGKYVNAVDEKKIISDYKKEWKGTKTEFALAHGLASIDSLNYVLRKHGESINAPRRELTYEECEQIARQFRTRKEFRNKRSSVYRRVVEMGWLESFGCFKKKLEKWTFERCLTEAKKYKIKVEFKKQAPGAYRVACKNKWLKDSSGL